MNGTTTSEPERVLRVADVAKHLDVEVNTVYALINSGQIRSVHIGRLIRVPVSAVNDFIAGKQSC